MDKISKMIYGVEYNENFAIIIADYGKKFELLNHFDALIPREGFNIDKNKLLNIKKRLCDIKEDCDNVEEEIRKCANKTISGKTGKPTGSRLGSSIWNIYYPITRKNKNKDTFNKYNIKKKNDELKDNEKVIYTKVTECLRLSQIIVKFKKENMIQNGIKEIIDNFKDIIIDKINDKIITNKEIVNLLNINDETAKNIHNCICYECSGINGNKKNLKNT